MKTTKFAPSRYAPLAMTLVLAACGASSKSSAPAAASTSPGTDTNPTTATPGLEGTTLVSDAGAASQTVAAQVDSGIAAAATEPQASASVALALAPIVSKDDEFTRSRACAVSGSDAAVAITQDAKRDYTLTGPNRTLANTFEAYYQETRTWSRSGGSVACSADGKYADIAVADLGGLTLSDIVKESRTRQITLTNLKSKKVTTQGSKFASDGTRQITWQSVTTAGGDYTIQKQVVHSLTQTTEVTKKDGTMQSMSSSVATAAAAPLAIQVVRDQTSLAVIKRTIQSGELDSVFKDGTKITTVFADVAYDAASESACVPVSGSITGTVTPPTGPASTFTITFGDTPTITFANGTSADYVQDGCAFEEDPAKAVDVASAAQVAASAQIAPAAPSDGTVAAVGTATATATATGS